MMDMTEQAQAAGASLGFPPTTIAVFVGLAVLALALDLAAHRKDKPITLLSASLWSVFWVFISMVFAGYLYFTHGPEIASLFVTGYALEKVLSVDNLFVFMAIFAWFNVPGAYRHRVLFWGIIGAIVFRLIFVAVGTGLLALGPWVELVFAAIVIWTAVMMFRSTTRDEQEEVTIPGMWPIGLRKSCSRSGRIFMDTTFLSGAISWKRKSGSRNTPAPGYRRREHFLPRPCFCAFVSSRCPMPCLRSTPCPPLSQLPVSL